jgi:hypothetical protein
MTGQVPDSPAYHCGCCCLGPHPACQGDAERLLPVLNLQPSAATPHLIGSQNSGSRISTWQRGMPLFMALAVASAACTHIRAPAALWLAACSLAAHQQGMPNLVWPLCSCLHDCLQLLAQVAVWGTQTVVLASVTAKAQLGRGKPVSPAALHLVGCQAAHHPPCMHLNPGAL